MVKINDVTLRDGQQSLLSGRVQQADLLRAAEASKDLPYNMYEVWGGTCFDMPLKEKGENPFQNLREFRETLGEKANLSMLLRCQNLVGYEPHDMSIVQSFIEEAAKPFGHDNEQMGINTFRIFDSLNDTDNMIPVIKAVRALKDDRGWDVSAQGTLSYTVVNDEQRADILEKSGDAKLAETLYTPEYYAQMAKTLVDAGAESICIKDMAGLLDAEHAGPLVKALKEAVNVPIVLHAQSGLGLSDEAIIAAVEAGIDEVDTTSIAMSGGSGHSATETILDTIERRCPEHLPDGFDREQLNEAAKVWRSIRPKYANFENPYDPELQKLIEQSQVPGGMTTTLRTQIKNTLSVVRPADPADVETFLKATLKEMANVRADVGYITLVTPSSQIVGTQAVAHVNQVFHQLKAQGNLSLKSIEAAIAENRKSNAQLSSMTPAFAKLALGKLGALPYPPEKALADCAKEMGAAEEKPVTLEERKKELQSEVLSLLNPENVEGISEHRQTELLQRRGVLGPGIAEKLERMAYEPTAQELLMYAIKPVNATKEQQGRLMALTHLLDPNAAKQMGYGADTAPELPATLRGLDAETVDAVERYAQAQLWEARLAHNSIRLNETDKRYQFAVADGMKTNALADVDRKDPMVRAALQARLNDFGIGAYGHKLEDAKPSTTLESGSWRELAERAGAEARRDNPRFQD